MQSVPTQYYYYMPVPMEGDQQQGYPMGAFAVETPEPEVVQPKEETKKEIKHKCDTEDQKKKKKPKFKKLSGCQKFFIVIGALSLVGFFMKLLGVGIGLTILSHMYHSCENPPHHVDRQWATNPSIASNIKIDITSAMVHVRTCPHAKSITIHTSSRSKNPEDLTRMVPSYFVMDGTISVIAKFPAFDFDSCASVKVDIVVPESLASPANLFVTSETGAVYIIPNKHHKEHHEEHHFRLKNETRPFVFNNIDISTKAGHVEVANVNTRGSVSIFSKVGGVTLKDLTASFITGSTVTGFVNVERVRVGQLTTIADSGSVNLRDIVFEEKVNLDQYFLLASIDLGSLRVKGIRNKLNDEHTALVTINSGSGHADVKLSKKSNLKFAVSTESGAIELHGKNLPALVENTETAKTGRIEGQGSLTDVTIATSSGRAHVNFRECKKHHGKHHEEKDHKGDSDKDEPTQDEHHDEDPATTTTEHDKPKIHPHHTKPHKTNEPKTGGMHVERPHRTRA